MLVMMAVMSLVVMVLVMVVMVVVVLSSLAVVVLEAGVSGPSLPASSFTPWNFEVFMNQCKRVLTDT